MESMMSEKTIVRCPLCGANITKRARTVLNDEELYALTQTFNFKGRGSIELVRSELPNIRGHGNVIWDGLVVRLMFVYGRLEEAGLIDRSALMRFGLFKVSERLKPVSDRMKLKPKGSYLGEPCTNVLPVKERGWGEVLTLLDEGVIEDGKGKAIKIEKIKEIEWS